jgi:DNA-binding CsgD family transcriptional regulator/DNA-binding winged helix-turn-helix (wHTH) protein
MTARKSAAKRSESKLLLVGGEADFAGKASERSATLLDALARLSSEPIDVILLSQSYRDEELALFAADARRKGFDGLILRVASAQTQRWSDEVESALSFTDRQRAVLEQVCRGQRNREIARALQTSEASVKAAIQDLFRKLNVRTRTQIVRVAMEKQLLPRQERQSEDRIAALGNLEQQPTIEVGDFVIDVAMHRTWIRGSEIRLTPREFQLLCLFALQPGKLVRSSALRSMLWSNPTSRVDSLRVLVGSLRAKIEVSRTPRYLVTQHTLGYRFIPSP